MLHNKMMGLLLLWVACSASIYAAGLPEKTNPQKQIAPIDRIVAVVNDDVITRHELDERLGNVVKQLQKQGTSLPASDALEKQVLERMIIDMLQAQFAKETGVHVDDTQLDKAIQNIAQENKFSTLAEFRDKLAQIEIEMLALEYMGLRTLADEKKLPVFIGEFGLADGGKRTREQVRSRFEDVLTAMDNARVDLAVVWVFDLPGQNNTWNITFENNRSYMLDLVAAANKHWKTGR